MFLPHRELLYPKQKMMKT